MRAIAEAEHWMVEGSAALALAGLSALRDDYAGRKIAVILCGRNIGLHTFLQAIGPCITA